MAKQSTPVEPAGDDVAAPIVADTAEVSADTSAAPTPDVVVPAAPAPAPTGFLVLWPVDHDGRRYDPGSMIPAETISADAAARLRAIGAIGG